MNSTDLHADLDEVPADRPLPPVMSGGSTEFPVSPPDVPTNRWSLPRALSWGFAVAAIFALSWAIIELSTGFEQSDSLERARRLLISCLAIQLALSAVLIWRIMFAWRAQQSALASSRLFRRLMGFSIVSAGAPALVVSTTAILAMTLGLQGFFGERVKSVVTESSSTATSFMDQHLASQASEAQRLAFLLTATNFGGLDLTAQLTNQRAVNTALTVRSRQLELDWAVLLGVESRKLETKESDDSLLGDQSMPVGIDLTIFGSGGQNPPADIAALVSMADVLTLGDDDILVLSSDNDSVFRAIVRYPGEESLYVLVGNAINPAILNRLETTRAAADGFEDLSANITAFQQLFTLLFVVTALALALFAAWGSLRLANDLARPILRVTNAAELLARGQWSVRVPFQKGRRRNELDTLALTFNKMANDLGQQQSALREANENIEERRRFTEAVLSGVSAGVIGLDAKGNIDLPNDTASHLLDKNLVESIGQSLGDAVPGFMPLLEAAHEDPSGVFSEEVTITRRNGSPRQLLTNAVADASNGIINGYVFTFDDVTDLQLAQRQAAWSDVARRIAHEIKNPLTPIQLSAERLKRRYLKDIENNPQLFSDLVDTIVRQVGEIGRMVDEFSGFARMPEPRMSEHDLRDIVRQAVFLQASAFAHVEVMASLPDEPMKVTVDEQLMSQAIINLVKNAAENLEGLLADGKLTKGRVQVDVLTGDDPNDPEIKGPRIEIRDNGTGYPVDLLPKLMEPYVTTREKGTGLGLAIVRKVMEDHGGALKLLNSDSKENLCGARAVLLLNV